MPAAWSMRGSSSTTRSINTPHANSAGPSISTDTACSSSLVATHLAHKGLLEAETTGAVAGGTNIMLSPITTVAICQLQALSVEGRCKSFDAGADGYGRGDGFAVVVLGRAPAAASAVAILQGTAVNQDGQSSGLTAPNGPAQTRLVLNTLRQASMQPSSLRFVAVHGTGTPLGDPIEVGALAVAMKGRRTQHHDLGPVMLGSIKSCYGHTEGAAGLTGLLLAANAAHARAAAPVMHLRSINPYVAAALGDWTKADPAAAAVPRQMQALPQSSPSQSFVGNSSFGMSGVNAHAIVQSASLPAVSSGDVDAILLRQRSWPLPERHAILHAAGLTTSQKATAVCNLSRAALASIWDAALLGQPVLPLTTMLDLMAGMGRLYQATGKPPAVANAVMIAPLSLKDNTLLTCAIDFKSSSVQVLIGDLIYTSGDLCPVPSIGTAATSAASDALLGSLLGQAMPGTARIPSSTAVLPPSSSWDPAINEAAVQLMSANRPEAAQLPACGMYTPQASTPGMHLVAFGSSEASVHDGGNLPRAQLRDMIIKPVWELQLSATANRPTWQLQWQPVEYPSAAAMAPLLLVSTEPSVPKLFPFAPDAPPSLSAVWGKPGGLEGHEICIGSDAHFALLLSCVDATRCVFVQPPAPAPVATSAALATYQAVARSSKPMKLALVTFDAHDMQPSATPQPSVTLLQGTKHKSIASFQNKLSLSWWKPVQG